MARTDHSVFAGSGSPAAAPAALRGRGAVTNVRHRFQSEERIADPSANPSADAGVDEDAAARIERIASSGSPAALPLRTAVSVEQARKLLSRNDSPDVPFDRAINTYRGCEHGCVYCYARPTHAYLGYSPGLDFETRLIAKANAVDALRAELAKPGYRVEPINIGSATDVYQPIERDWRLTRGVISLLLETGHPLTIVTKNALIERDLDLLQALARRKLVAVYISITSLDDVLSRTLEPRASAPWRRLQTVRRLAEAGVPVGVLAAPMIPFINDEYLERIVEAAGQAGAYYASYTVVRLPWEVKPVFEEWLQAHFPDRAERVLHRIEDMREGKRNDPKFGSRMRGTGIWAELLRQRFAIAVRKAGLNQHRLQLDTRQFVPPAAVSQPFPGQPSPGMPSPGMPRGAGVTGGGPRSLPESARATLHPMRQLGLFDQM
ncbi:radical SAM protein [Bordetella genomosp. 9]|uniref:PA0069 family radical SAM protein n=1 Tax=Bordetella genomosp. 9 TaxID=1416803 RepID=UPI000A28E250|nr:PA0069 family radical SAM protein [Bordetella genomosp. 9]ARP90003.1 radical SAM protein [Bordetella genomosp. 9]